MIQLAPRIFRILPVAEPLSADAFLIEGDTRWYVYDVGSSDAAYEAIAALQKPVTVIISHFHRDHTANLSRLSPETLYVGTRTCKQLGQGTVIDAPMTLLDGVSLDIRPCVSPHVPGALILTVDGTYTLIGDLAYARPGEGQGEAKGMYRVLKELGTQYFVPSHRGEDPLVPKEAFLREIRAQFGF